MNSRLVAHDFTVRKPEEVSQGGFDARVFLDEDPHLMTKMMTAVYQVQLADWLERGEDGDPANLIHRIQRHIQHLLCGGSAPRVGGLG